MRLLTLDSSGEASLTQIAYDKPTPAYAILSHTWGEEEVTFQDMPHVAKTKQGYSKLAFCGGQAARDNLQYFWADTCCIDKSSSAELQESINSMFRWYRDAAVCYVYLADVSASGPHGSTPVPSPATSAWDDAFRRSRWFTRGWTLQELIAPKSVEFFSKEGILLGTKASLERQICEITGIPAKALQAEHDLSSFTIDERMAWTRTRKTTREEDMAYSLLGIFKVHMPLIYSEGKDKALARLKEEIDKDSKGVRRADYSVTFGLPAGFGVEQFVARKDELAKIHGKLQGNDSRRVVVLHGLRGIGKTQLAIAYAKRHNRDYSAVFWLNAKDKVSIQQSFAKAAEQIQRAHPAAQLGNIHDKRDPNEVVDAVRAWFSLADNTRWLLIYDNYDNPKQRNIQNPNADALDIGDFFPESDQGSVIITTSDSRVKIGANMHVTKLGADDSIEILSTTSGREGIADDAGAAELARKLDGLPLALATAGAYLEQLGTSFSEYLRLYNTSWAKLQRLSPQLSTYDYTLYSTWQLSFEHVEQQNPLSACLLRLWAYFDNQDVWFELLQHKPNNSPPWIPPWMCQLTEDKLNFDNAVRVLVNHGLVEADKTSQQGYESSGYRMHGCVHKWTIHVLNQTWDPSLARLAIHCVALNLPGLGNASSWATERRLVRHAAQCTSTLSDDITIDLHSCGALLCIADFFSAQFELHLAEPLYERILEFLQAGGCCIGKRRFDLHAMSGLGQVYLDQGNLTKAEKIYSFLCKTTEKEFGIDDKVTLYFARCIATVYGRLGKIDLAEKMYQRILQGTEKSLGPDHLCTVSCLYYIGSLYLDQHRITEAHDMLTRALQGFERTLGEGHEWTLGISLSLGRVYQSQGKVDKAEIYLKRALHGFEKTIGPEFPDVYGVAIFLGVLYSGVQGKLDEAEVFLKRGLHGYEKLFDSKHYFVIRAASALRKLYISQGRPEDALQVYSEYLEPTEERA